MTKLEIITFLNGSNFVEGGVYSYFRKENGGIVYLILNETDIEVLINDCKKTLTFTEFVEKYNDNTLYEVLIRTSN